MHQALGSGPSPGPWWGPAKDLGFLKALQESGSAGDLRWDLVMGPSLGPHLGSPLGPGGALWGPWALWGDRVLMGPLQLRNKNYGRYPKTPNIPN